jgi:hypothetical protein
MKVPVWYENGTTRLVDVREPDVFRPPRSRRMSVKASGIDRRRADADG